jgi:hypothetical protein
MLLFQPVGGKQKQDNKESSRIIDLVTGRYSEMNNLTLGDNLDLSKKGMMIETQCS